MGERKKMYPIVEKSRKRRKEKKVLREGEGERER